MRPDYVLSDSEGSPAVIVEAKRIEYDTKNEENWDQVDRYCSGMPAVKVLAITNGQFWTIAFPGESCRSKIQWEPDYMPLGIQTKVNENARRLYDALAASKFGWEDASF